MTSLLESVFKKAGNLPPESQDSLARLWLAELEDQKLWDEKFAETGEVIDTLAERALLEHAQGKTISKGIDEL